MVVVGDGGGHIHQCLTFKYIPIIEATFLSRVFLKDAHKLVRYKWQKDQPPCPKGVSITDHYIHNTKRASKYKYKDESGRTIAEVEDRKRKGLK